ncbi:hypothetical protein [Kribbella sindirgiensis]|uniref:Uncharacterized protein n=1 Tax=Kribbella sindirgiensis TaxID=1124744 RepID=A0A4R0IR55_9ACTN|nr:hypothetical protein [Kribbella sindirgiensis]TCC33798.1 hypothetical protein E0H50_17865 [Kribbella sindirgiensis]
MSNRAKLLWHVGTWAQVVAVLALPAAAWFLGVPRMAEYMLDSDGVHVVGTVYPWQRDYRELTLWSDDARQMFARVKCGTAFTSEPSNDRVGREACSAMEQRGRLVGIGLVVVSIGGLIGGSRLRSEHRKNQKRTTRERRSPWDAWSDD